MFTRRKFIQTVTEGAVAAIVVIPLFALESVMDNSSIGPGNTRL